MLIRDMNYLLSYRDVAEMGSQRSEETATATPYWCAVFGLSFGLVLPLLRLEQDNIGGVMDRERGNGRTFLMAICCDFLSFLWPKMR